MPAWLFEGNLTVYFLLVCAELVLLALWWRTRQRKYAFSAGVVAGLTLGYYLLDRFVESDREQIVRKTQEVAAAVTAGDIERAFRNVSDSFKRGTVDKTHFREFAQRVRNERNVTEVQVWDFVFPGEVSREARPADVEFRFKVRGRWGESPPNYFARVGYVLDPDGEWRVQTFDVYDSLTESSRPIYIPGWGQ
jgi:hypothetical protein